MDNELQKIIDAVIKRGHDVQIQKYKDGYKVFEVTRRLIATVTTENETEKPR